MLINNIKNGGDDEESYRKLLRIRIFAGAVFIAAGIALIIIVYAITGGQMVIDDHRSDFSSGLFTGLGAGFIGAGAASAIKTLRLIRNPESFKKSYVEYSDERNRFVLMKSYQITGMVFFIFLPIAAVAAMFVSITITNVLLSCMGIFALIFVVTRFIVNRRY